MYETTLFLLYFTFMLTCYNNYYSSQKELDRDWSEINSQLVSLRATLGQNLRKSTTPNQDRVLMSYLNLNGFFQVHAIFSTGYGGMAQ